MREADFTLTCMSQRGRPRHPELLTPREQDVLALLRDGLTNEQIASGLGIMFETAKWHVSAILSKLGVATREEAAALPAEEGRWPLSRIALALAGTAVVAGAVAGLALLAWGVQRSGDDGQASAVTVSASAAATAILQPTAQVRRGPPITTADAQFSLPQVADAQHYYVPLAGYKDELVVEIQPVKGPDAETTPSSYALWNPATGTIMQLWTGEAGKPEMVWGEDGDWLLTVERGGYGETIGMNDWTIYARNIATGKVIQVAQHIESDQTPPPGTLPPNQVILHDTPNPSVSSGKIVWSEAETGANGAITSRVLMYDLTVGTKQTVVESTDSGRDALWDGMIAGGKLGWALDDGSGYAFVTRDLATGQEERYNIDKQPYSATMSADGSLVFWDVVGTKLDKHVLDLATKQDKTIALYQGWGTYVNGRYLSWDTTMNGPGSGPAGLYDVETNTLRSINSTESVETNIAHVMGDWYVWQVMPLGPNESDDQDFYYAMRLSP